MFIFSFAVASWSDIASFPACALILHLTFKIYKSYFLWCCFLIVSKHISHLDNSLWDWGFVSQQLKMISDATYVNCARNQNKDLLSSFSVPSIKSVLFGSSDDPTYWFLWKVFTLSLEFQVDIILCRVNLSMQHPRSTVVLIKIFSAMTSSVVFSSSRVDF